MQLRGYAVYFTLSIAVLNVIQFSVVNVESQLAETLLGMVHRGSTRRHAVYFTLSIAVLNVIQFSVVSVESQLAETLLGMAHWGVHKAWPLPVANLSSGIHLLCTCGWIPNWYHGICKQHYRKQCLLGFAKRNIRSFQDLLNLSILRRCLLNQLLVL